MGVATGCGCKEVYRFPLPTPLVSVLFYSSIPSLLFVHFLNVFRSLYILCTIWFVYTCTVW